jgi:hypothetical protein
MGEIQCVHETSTSELNYAVFTGHMISKTLPQVYVCIAYVFQKLVQLTFLER